ncbi:MAG: PD-(D/E)XK nuclease-like domain-containing protein [Tannerellaceae bacterium]|jgi:hypothetical protein|nr:PD-(D/E)XK nuclease-like domain-containing protein [Tannerellaceae bacterium]
MTDNYYHRNEVSNSDLSWLKDRLYPKETVHDPTAAYAFGSLIDAMITEPERVNYFKRTMDGKRIKKELFDNAAGMKKAFWNDEFCRSITEHSQGQKISVLHDKKFDYRDYEFKLDVRCKWDIWREDWKWGGDIKSTTATTQAQFEAAARYFDYDRQRAWYMDIENAERDVLIGISKANHKIFKIFINRDSEFYRSGKDKYMELAFRWFLLFGKTK